MPREQENNRFRLNFENATVTEKKEAPLNNQSKRAPLFSSEDKNDQEKRNFMHDHREIQIIPLYIKSTLLTE